MGKKTEPKKDVQPKSEPKKGDLTKIKAFLEERNQNYEAIDEKTIIVPYEIGGKLFKPTIVLSGAWLVVSCLIIESKDLPAKDDKYVLDLFKKMLLAIHELPEINYDIDESNNIYTSVDMRLDITDYNNFFSEFFAVPYGVKHFVEKIAPSMNPRIDVKGCSE
nr:hypothetical protein [Candidatus Sigynarchaeota archaeon]